MRRFEFQIMKKLLSPLLLVAILLCASTVSNAQTPVKKENKFSMSASADASMFQLALTEIGGQSDVSTLRYTYFFNTGTHLNYKINNGLTFFSGITLRNLGLIIKNDSSTSKFRTYNIGIPLGFKIKTGKKQYVLVGGGVDFPINYKSKYWTGGRKNKLKDNEWFSNKVNPIMPYVQLGYRMKSGFLLKFMYYPSNFWNNDHPFHTNTNANIMALTLGMDISKKSKNVEIKLPSGKKKK